MSGPVTRVELGRREATALCGFLRGPGRIYISINDATQKLRIVRSSDEDVAAVIELGKAA
jgi:hypothetical protein